MLTYEQHLEDLKSDRGEKHRQSYEDVKMGVKRKNELVDAVPDNKKLKVFEHLKVMAENDEVSNEDVNDSDSDDGLNEDPEFLQFPNWKSCNCLPSPQAGVG